jgi:DNA-binding transcriptional LysR family regulator
MELRQLEYLVAVADEASFTRAAERVHVAQPGVSAQVRRLEAELGQPLLDRSGRTVRPTGAGAAVLPYARAALAAVAAARLAVDELAGLVRGHVAVGMITGGVAAVPEMLAGFHRRHPGVQMTLTEDGSDALLAAIRAGELDLALVGAATAPPAGVATQVVLDDALVAAVALEHPLRSRATITLRALAGEALVCLPRGTGLRSALDRACAAAGLRPHVAFEASDPVMLADLAARGLGVAILPRSLAEYRAADLHALEIIRPALRSRLELAWRADGPSGPAGRALVEHAREAMAR